MIERTPVMTRIRMFQAYARYVVAALAVIAMGVEKQ